MEIDKLLKTRNWFNYSQFYEMIAKKPDINKLVEIGVWKGHSISFLAKKLLENKKNFELYAVDIWDIGAPEESGHWPNWKGSGQDSTHSHLSNSEARKIILENIYEIYKRNLEIAGVESYIKDIKSISWEAANKFPDKYFDFVYIDAGHTYEAVIKDIKAWLPKVRDGGIISGHDYYDKGDNEVFRAVNDLRKGGMLKNKINTYSGSVWSMTKNG